MAQTEIQYDTEFGKWIEFADAYIDSVLQRFTTVPLVSVPKIITWVSAYFAAAAFVKARDRMAGDTYRIPAEMFLRSYCENKYMQGEVVRAGSEEDLQ